MRKPPDQIENAPVGDRGARKTDVGSVSIFPPYSNTPPNIQGNNSYPFAFSEPGGVVPGVTYAVFGSEDVEDCGRFLSLDAAQREADELNLLFATIRRAIR